MSKNCLMRRAFLLVLLCGVSALLFSCAPVLDRSLMREGDTSVSFRALRANPEEFKSRLYIFGGVIVRTRLTAEGSQIEALHVPVDSQGYFSDQGQSEGRFLALLPSNETILDPEVYQQGRRVTLAGRFIGLRKERIEEMEYVYPVFHIEQIYLWQRETYYYPGYYYDPWFYPYPYYYWYPWWGYPYYPYYYPGYYYGPPYQHVPHAEPRRQPVPQTAPPSQRMPAPDRPAPR